MIRWSKILLLVVIVATINTASATWSDTSLYYKSPMLINNTQNANNFNNHTVFFNISYQSGMNADFSDVRIYNEVSGAQLSLFNETIVNGIYMTGWFNATTITASAWMNTTYYLYWGNPAKTSVSSAENTFVKVISGLTAKYFLDGDVNDYSGNGDNGVATGITYSDNVLYGQQAASFDNSTSYITVSSIIPLATTGTIHKRVYMSNWSDNVLHTIFDSQDGAGNHRLLLRKSATNTIYFFMVRTGGDAEAIIESAAQTGSGYKNLTITWTAGNASLYIDNVFVGSDTVFVMPTFGSQTIARIGADATVGLTSKFNGQINGFSYYNKVLNTSELAANNLYFDYATTIAPGRTYVRKYSKPEPSVTFGATETQLSVVVGNWHLDEMTGNYANDSSTFGNNGTITGATWNLTDFVNGSSLYFDGNDYVTVDASSSINISTAQSFTGWIKPQSISGHQTIFEKGGTNWEYAVSLNDATLEYNIFTSDGNFHARTEGGTVLNDTWIFISGTYTNGSLQTLYINNVLIDSETTFTGTTTPGTDPLRFGTRTATQFNFTGLMDELKLYNYALNATELTTEYQRFQPFLSYPLNGSTITTTYPPQTTNINFTWHDSEYPADELIVARDINFNLIEVDIFTSDDFYSATLNNNQTYYWKIKQYNTTTGTYGETSSTHNFTITTTISPSGNSGIFGVVYEIINGLQVPVSGATVYISNSSSTWSNFQVVGSNGYYLFDGLSANTTYYLSARAIGYDNSVTEFVTTGNGTWIQKDIKLTVCISGQDCFGIKNYVKFIATDFFGNYYPNLAVSVYKGSDVTTTYTGTTGTDGGVSFLLTKDQSYRLVFTGSAITTTSITITPGESTLFYVFVSAASPGKYWDNSSYQPVDVIRTGVTTSTSGSLGFVNVTYNDSLGQTTAWTIFLNQTNHTDPTAPQVTIQSATGTGNASVGFTLTSGFTGEAYIVNIKATHTTFGQVLRSYGVQFYGTKDGSLDYIPSAIMALIAIMILVFVGSFFDSTNFAQGAGLICAIGWVEVGLGMFSYSGMYVSVIVGLSIASVIAIVANMNERNKREVVG